MKYPLCFFVGYVQPITQQYKFFCVLVSIKIGGEVNLANWRFVTKLPNLNFANIIFIPCVQVFDSSCSNRFRQTKCDFVDKHTLLVPNMQMAVVYELD